MAEKARQPLPWDMRVLVRESGVEMPYTKYILIGCFAYARMNSLLRVDTLTNYI